MPLKGVTFKKLKTSTKVKNIFNQCAEHALTGDMRSKHCACLVRKGKIYTMNCNQAGSTNGFSTHAETTVHKKISNSKILKKKNRTFDLYVIRFSEKNGFMNSKPCYNCTKCIVNEMDYVNRIFYSYNNETYIIENRDTLKSTHMSNGHINFRNKTYWNH